MIDVDFRFVRRKTDEIFYEPLTETFQPKSFKQVLQYRKLILRHEESIDFGTGSSTRIGRGGYMWTEWEDVRTEEE